MDPRQREALMEAISLLKIVAGEENGSKTAKTVRKTVIPVFDTQLNECFQFAKKLPVQIQQLTAFYIQAIQAMRAIMGHSAHCPKFTPKQQELLKNKFLKLIPQVQKLQKGDYIDHAKAIKELLSTAFWVFVNTPQIMFKSAIQSSDFYAMKFQKKKVAQHNEWYKKIMEAARNLQKFVIQNHPDGLIFNGKGTQNWQSVISGQEKAPQPEAKLKPEIKETAPVEKKAKKSMSGQNLCLLNLEGDKIELGEKQISMKNGILLENCQNIVLTVNVKCKSIQLNKCKKVFVVIVSCVTGVQIMNSQNINIRVKDSLPSFSGDSSQNLKLILNVKNLHCQILTTKVSQMHVSYEELDGNQSKDYSVTEQLLTKWNSNKNCFETTTFKQQYD